MLRQKETLPLKSAREAASPLEGEHGQYQALLESIGDAEIVLLGEASHGTHEFYQTRAEITRRLIEERGFTAVAVEGDWPDCYRVNRYVRGLGTDPDADAALGDFQRFPLWMWRNTVVKQFVQWLRQHNKGLPYSAQTGFYGLDMYSLYGSVAAVIQYLQQVDPEAADEARQRYACFDHVGEGGRSYAYGLRFGSRSACSEEVMDQVLALRQNREEYLMRDGLVADEEHFAAEQNARVVQSAESYYRNMFSYSVSTWNLRDQHMMDTLRALKEHLSRRGKPARIVVWEHNSHIGDARATEMGRRGEHNVGQLTREAYGEKAMLIGFTTYGGTVTAASSWDGPAEHKRVRPGLEDSYETVFHDFDLDRFFLPLRGDAAQALVEPRLQRAIGVIYLPDTERESHYFMTQLPRQFDGIVHIDHTRALEPLDPTSEWQLGEPETYPSGL